MYWATVNGHRLNRFRILKYRDIEELKLHADALAGLWDMGSEVLDAVESGSHDYERKALNTYFVHLQNSCTKEAEEKIKNLQTLLIKGLESDCKVDWESFKQHGDFNEPSPFTALRSLEETFTFKEREPDISDQKYIPSVSFIGKLFGGGKSKVEADINAFNADHKNWLDRKNKALSEMQVAKEQLNQWEHRKANHSRLQAEFNKAIDELKQNYIAGNAEAIVEYVDIVLGSSIYPDCFQDKYDLEYTPSTKTLLVEYLVPYIDNLTKIKEWKFTASTGLLSAKVLSQTELNRLFDDVIYQTSLRVLHEIFASDEFDHIDSIVFNGRVEYIDKSTGHETSACIVSLQASKDEFMAINLANVDPKACFKTLKGVASSKLHGISPIAPIMNMRREDGRFVSAQEIANTVNDSTNLAAMDWQDFEHLIREIFEKEFSTNGGEVKITQASRDGGVDAVAFDPDPIRGGKIVIQAKRYTNTVTVSAVRDLYGTVMNEGATKGILVTTSDYGPDAYNFIKDKPLVLLNGANLLHLLEKHGHKARIDIQEAKLING